MGTATGACVQIILVHLFDESIPLLTLDCRDPLLTRTSVEMNREMPHGLEVAELDVEGPDPVRYDAVGDVPDHALLDGRAPPCSSRVRLRLFFGNRGSRRNVDSELTPCPNSRAEPFKVSPS